MLRPFQKAASSLSAAPKTAQSATRPPKRGTMQKWLDLGFHGKPLGTSFVMMQFRQGRISANHSDSLGAAGARAGRGCGPGWALAQVSQHLPKASGSLPVTKLGELQHHLQWKTAQKGGCWASSNLEIPLEMSEQWAGISLTPLLPHNSLVFICSTNRNSKLNSEMLGVYQDHSSTEESVMCCRLSQRGVICTGLSKASSRACVLRRDFLP